MGTNYFYRTNICDGCERFDVRHVGKKSAGWTFHFQGYRWKTGADEDIVSIADWARLFKTTTGVLVDEYERVIGDPLRWLSQLERPTKAQQEDEDSLQRRSTQIDPATEWRDSKGFAFYDGYFS